MDKTMAFILIGFFIICACLITWAAFGGPKRSIACKLMAYGYAALFWMCIIAMIVITIIY